MADSSRVTRGHGLLEGFLAQKRRAVAEKLIPETARAGRILDIGCGSFPLLLASTRFAEKYGLERVTNAETIAEFERQGITLKFHDLERCSTLPFDDGYFDVVTMLAVIEHLPRRVAEYAVAEFRRVLKPGGVLIITTPAAFTERILKILCKLNLVSPEEIEEHQEAYTRLSVAETLQTGGFADSTVETGLFELGMNTWARARK